MSGLSVSSSSSPIYEPFATLPPEIIREIALHLDVHSICAAAQVCHRWRIAIYGKGAHEGKETKFDYPEIFWSKLFDREGIPRVIGSSSEPCNLMEDFKFLYPMTISGEKISQYFGQIGGKVPAISKAFFDFLQEEDPFDEKKPGNSIAKNYALLVFPAKITRISDDKNTPLALDHKGNLIESSGHSSSSSSSTVTSEYGNLELEVPFTFPNLVMLCKYPLKVKKKGRVFSSVNKKVLDQCNACSTEDKVYLMRKRIVEQSRGKFYNEQKELVNAQGWDVTPLRVRSFYDNFKILFSGDCPDNQKPRTYARTSDIVYDYDVSQADIGDYSPHNGIEVDSSYCGVKYFGVVPCIQAQVIRPKALESSESLT